MRQEKTVHHNKNGTKTRSDLTASLDITIQTQYKRWRRYVKEESGVPV